jgi:8-oxo-dGTP pyrophosphatase MutT (NUDIX family)
VITRLPQSVHVCLVHYTPLHPLYVIFKRAPRPELALPGFWQGISGALEPGESFEEAAQREVLEETGLTIKNFFASGFSHTYPIKDEWRSSYGNEVHEVEERAFYALLDPGAVPHVSAEHVEWVTLPISQASELLTFGRTRDCLLSVHECLQHRDTLLGEHHVGTEFLRNRVNWGQTPFMKS